MKKIFEIGIMMILSCTIAKGQVKKELGFIAGSSVKGYNQIDTRVDFAWTFEVSRGLNLGVGTGFRYSRPMDSLREKEGTKANKTFVNGIGLPLFVRACYSFPKNIFIQADAGYQLGVLSFDLADFYFYPTCRSITGFFAEPQVGISFKPGKTISFGLSLQGHPFLHNKEYTDSSGIFTHSGGTDHTFDAIAFIRFCIEL